MKKLCVSLLTLLVLFAFVSKPDKTNFSGEWKLNESKSDLGQFGNFATRTIKAEQKEDAINIARTAPSFNGGENTTSETLTFDGKESESPLFGNSKKKASIKWAEDGQTFSITYTLLLDFQGQQSEVNGVETWSLSDEGKTLSVQNSSSSSFGDMTTKAVYEKK